MSGMLEYAHLASKIRAMKGKMLKTEDYQQLLQKKSVKDIANYLKNNTYYAETLKDLDETDAHRGDLELKFEQAIVNDAIKVAKYLRGADKKVFKFVYLKHDIEDIKRMFRTLLMGKKLTEIDSREFTLGEYSFVDFKTALAARNIRDLVDTLKGSIFYDTLSPLVKQENELDLFAAEMALDLFYYDTVFETLKRYKASKGTSKIETAIRMEADLKNIFMIYRGKKYYGVTKELLHLYLIPFHYKLRKEDFDQLIEAANAEELVQLLQSKYYSTKIQFSQDNWEHQFYELVQYIMRSSMVFDPYTISPMMAYIYLKEIECMNVTTIIEGIRYQVDTSSIKELLVVDF